MINSITPVSIALVRKKSNVKGSSCSFHFGTSFAGSRLHYSRCCCFVASIRVMVWTRCLFWIGLPDQFYNTCFYILGYKKIKWASPMCGAVLLSLRQLFAGSRLLYSRCCCIVVSVHIMVWAMCLFWIGLHDQFLYYTGFYILGQNKIKWASPMCKAVVLSLRQLLCGQ